MNNKTKKMNNKPKGKDLYRRTSLQILVFLSLNPGDVFSAQEISRKAQTSKGATHQTLKRLLFLKIISRERKGNLFLYKLNQDEPILKYFKIFQIILEIQHLIQQIKPYCYQIILFGSCANGENVQGSDIDLFIKTDTPEIVQKFIKKYGYDELHIKAAIYDPLELLEAQKDDKDFFGEVRKGIVLWEGKPDHDEV